MTKIATLLEQDNANFPSSVDTPEYQVALAYYTAKKTETSDPRSLRCLDSVWSVGRKMLEDGEKITISAIARRCLDRFGEPSAQTIYNNSSGLNPLVKNLQAAQKASSSPKTKAQGNFKNGQAINGILDATNNPKHRSIIRDIFMENQQLKEDVRLLDSFLRQIKSVDFSDGHPKASEAIAVNQNRSALTQEEKKSIRDFFETILFNEGYDLRDGDIFKGRRPLQAADFVSAIMNLLND